MPADPQPLTDRQGTTPQAGARGVAAVVLALVAFSWGAPVVRLIDLSAAGITVWRLGIGAAALALAALLTRAQWPSRWRDVVVAGLFFGAHLLAFAVATQRTSIAIVTLVGALQPLLVALLSGRTVGERPPRALFGWSLCALAGVAMVVGANLDDPSRSALGDVAAVANALLYIGYFLCAKRARERGAPTLTFTLSVYSVALLVTVPALLLTGPAAPASAATWGWVALLALVPGNGHLLVNWAHPRVTAALSSLVLAALPVLAGLWARLLFDEPFGPRHLLGMLLVILAIEGGRRVERDRSRAVTSGAPAGLEPLPVGRA